MESVGTRPEWKQWQEPGIDVSEVRRAVSVRLDVDHIIRPEPMAASIIRPEIILQVLCVRCHSRKTYKEKKPQREPNDLKSGMNNYHSTKAAIAI